MARYWSDEGERVNIGQQIAKMGMGPGSARDVALRDSARRGTRGPGQISSAEMTEYSR